MKTIPFSEEEIDLAMLLNQNGIIWKPKSSDWFIDLNSLKVLYSGEFQQSVALCLVLDEDGRSFSYLELLIDGEENGNRMKKSTSYSDHNTFQNMNWLPTIKDCIDIFQNSELFQFQSLEKKEDLFFSHIKNKKTGELISSHGKTELISLYNLILLTK